MSQHLPHLSTTRRTLLRTTAWSVPAVSLAAAAPAFATSNERLSLKLEGGWFAGAGTEGDSTQGMVGMEIRNDSATASSPSASVILDLSAVPRPPAGVQVFASGPDGKWPADWVRPVGWEESQIEGEPDSEVWVTQITDGSVLFHAAGIPADGQSSLLVLGIFLEGMLVAPAPTISASLTPPDGWGVSPESASQVVWQEV